jgi:hypothetical protein
VANYSTDQDLLEVRPDILDLGVVSWETQHTEAKRQIDRQLDVGWYRQVAGDWGLDWTEDQFDATLMLNASTQLKRLSVLKTLELAYMYLATSASVEPDAFMRQMELFRGLAEEEFRAVLASGIDYDWDASGGISDEEKAGLARRQLMRS